MSLKRVAIIIVTYNGSEYIGDCLSLLQNTHYSRSLFEIEIVIIDNGSTDTTREIVREYKKKQLFSLPSITWRVTAFFQEKNLGFAEGNNIGMWYAMEKNFDFVYLLNQDTEVEPNFLIEAIRVMEADVCIGAVQSRLMLFKKKDTINSIGNELHYLGFGYAGGHNTVYREDFLKSENIEIAYPSGAAVLYRIFALREVGLFDKKFFMYHEDTDLGWRLWLFGYRIRLAKNSIVYHKYEFSRSIEKYYFMERNRMILLLQNYKLGTLALLAPAIFFSYCAILIYSFFGHFWKEEFRAFFYFFHLQHWKEILKARKYIQQRRMVKDRDIVKRFTAVITSQELKNPLVGRVLNPLSYVYWKVIQYCIVW